MGKDANEIRREIERTRERMGDTVEALGYKADVPSRVKDAVNERVETVKGTFGDAVARVGSALGAVGDRTTQLAHTTTDRIGDAIPDVQTPNVGAVARRGAGLAKENPLGLALGALSVGFLAGLVAPVTDYEREKVGPVRDDLLERAQSVAGEAIEHGKAVLQETAQAAMSSAQEHGKAVAQSVSGQTNGTGGENREDAPSAAGMVRDQNEGGGLRAGTKLSGGTGAQTPGQSPGATTQYGALLDEEPELDDLTPGAPGTASP